MTDPAYSIIPANEPEAAAHWMPYEGPTWFDLFRDYIRFLAATFRIT